MDKSIKEIVNIIKKVDEQEKIILSIAGSDNTSGAGIQADIKTCQLLRVFCLNVVTVVTSQGQNKVEDYQLVSKR